MKIQIQALRHLWIPPLRWLLVLSLLGPVLAAGDGIPDSGVLDDWSDGGGTTRVKDIASLVGVRSNQLVGYGLVVGLDGTGDNTNSTKFTAQSLTNMLRQLGTALPPNVQIRSKNVAAVMVTASLPPFAKQGQTIDVTVASIGNAESLRGGVLLMTPLKGADGQVYALAQGSLFVGGFGARGSDGSKITVNVPSAGRIPNGAIVERTVESPFAEGGDLELNLHSPDFTTAQRMAEAINAALGRGRATAVDGGTVRVSAPSDPGQRVRFVARVENVTLEPGDAPARVVINARTGTVVIGEHVVVMPAAVSHGNLVVTITENPVISQPGPFSNGVTTEASESEIDVSQKSRMFLIEPGISLEEIVRAVNQVGAAPGDLVAILEALREAGALRASLVVI
jgi:flagellar P-ring protein precursor FlgI